MSNPSQPHTVMTTSAGIAPCGRVEAPERPEPDLAEQASSPDRTSLSNSHRNMIAGGDRRDGDRDEHRQPIEPDERGSCWFSAMARNSASHDRDRHEQDTCSTTAFTAAVRAMRIARDVRVVRQARRTGGSARSARPSGTTGRSPRRWGSEPNSDDQQRPTAARTASPRRGPTRPHAADEPGGSDLDAAAVAIAVEPSRRPRTAFTCVRGVVERLLRVGLSEHRLHDRRAP